MLTASQIAGFSNQLFLQKKWMKQPYCKHADTNSQKFLIGHGLKWVWPVSSQDSKIDCISRIN